MNIKNVIYVTSVLPESRENQMIEQNADKASIQAFKYHRLLCEGLSQNNIDVTVITYNKYNRSIGITDGFEENVGAVKYHYIVPKKTGKLAYVELLYKTYRDTLKHIQNDTAIICDVLNSTISYAALCAAKKTGIESVAIVTDFPNDSPKSINGRLSWRVIRNCSKWVLLTEQMYDYLGRTKKVAILEGHVDRKMGERDNLLEAKDCPKRCIYAGSLKRKYGILKLIEAFKLANLDNIELHIYGAGEIEDELRNMDDDRIIYHGVVPNSKVVDDEIHATLLINPRPTDGEYTKYSFPSKNLEYMVSGTPLLTTKLAGMPREYYEYVYLFENETVDGMAKTLKKILSKSGIELHQKGTIAKQFALSNKSNVAQARKILSLLNG